jgi:hypothetical protein
MGAQAVHGGLVAELTEARAFPGTAGKDVHVVSAGRHPLGETVAELGGPVDVGRVRVSGNQDGQPWLVVGHGHVESSWWSLCGQLVQWRPAGAGAPGLQPKSGLTP